MQRFDCMGTIEPVWRCYVCGVPATHVVRITGEDETPHEEGVCELHAHGHWRTAILTAREEYMRATPVEHQSRFTRIS